MISEFSKPKIGTVFQEESRKLCVFEKASILVLRGWPKPAAWRKTVKSDWYHCRPEIGFLSGKLDVERPKTPNMKLPPSRPDATRNRDSVATGALAWRRWHNLTPEEVRNAIAPLPKRCWHMLSLIARCGRAALDLAHSNPALAYALASNWVFHKPAVQRPLRSARALLAKGKKQRDIMAWLGFPPTESARKILRKVERRSLRITALLYLSQSLTVPEVVKALSHLPRINASALRIATDPQLLSFATPRLLEELAMDRREDRFPEAANTLVDCLEMSLMLHPSRAPQPIENGARLHEIHGDLLLQVNRKSTRLPQVTFPMPPLHGTSKIVPVTNTRGLAEEGIVQHNCVASYANRVAIRKTHYIYSVLEPQRCTLALVRAGDNWVIGELKGVCNQPATPATRKAVQQWLTASKVKCGMATHENAAHLEDERYAHELEALAVEEIPF